MEKETMSMIISGSIFVIAYILIITDKIERTLIALCGAALMIFLRVLSQEKAFHEIDYNTLGLLISMMVIVIITRKTGVFEYLGIKTVKLAKGEPWKIMLFLSIITGVLSAFLDNVTTILLIIPLTFSVAKDLHINPVPFIIAQIFASNTGGTATLIGDPPNIMIGGAIGLSFMDFIKNVAGVAFFNLIVTSVLYVIFYRSKIHTLDENKKKVIMMNENEAIKDKWLMVKSLTVLGLTILGFMLHGVFHYESATIAIAGAVVLLLISGHKPHKIFEEIEWNTIFFFAGLFILVGGIKESGLIKLLAEGILDVTNGNPTLTMLGILWVSAIASAFVDNIPFVATMIPMIQDLGDMSNMDLGPLWWALSLGACLGGNGTIIGASANVIASGMALEHGHKITFGKFFKVAFPMMIITLIISTIYMIIFYV
ncbi:Citrate transporter [Pseudobacteroides cellulosolvens ATCC 35603 = DSM 2933]|uniref:Citrate transporter n=2 Tax=Pseudobacteroides cellulosolvens TaxID=35825 RepID=A0A0L6JK42_9FIRM|nr:ArsB/NhaD family transporter [Pseudobacteroides cellulosolvens]KNY26144.1 Citrate transporter [Pseudobacteroides cellulosolvens ATCC 35603 = DSM 2933]